MNNIPHKRFRSTTTEWQKLEVHALCLLLVLVEQSASIQPESLLVPSVIADFVHQERMRGEGQNRSSVNR